MAKCLLCQRSKRTFRVYLVVRERDRLSGWKGQVCDECLAPWGNGEAMGGVAVMQTVHLPDDAGVAAGGD